MVVVLPCSHSSCHSTKNSPASHKSTWPFQLMSVSSGPPPWRRSRGGWSHCVTGRIECSIGRWQRSSALLARCWSGGLTNAVSLAAARHWLLRWTAVEVRAFWRSQPPVKSCQGRSRVTADIGYFKDEHAAKGLRRESCDGIKDNEPINFT